MASAVANRALGAIVGAAVADAAAQPLHCLYDMTILSKVLAENPNPEFIPESANPRYKRKTGMQSCYGDQAYVLLESLSECGGLDIDDLTQRTLNFFGPGSEYDIPSNDPYKAEEEFDKSLLPIDGPWRHASLKSFLKNIDAGNEETGCEEDCQMDGVTKLAPIVAFYAGKPDMLEKVESAIRVTQNNDLCVAVTLAAARILEHFILDGPDPQALDVLMNSLQDQNRKEPQILDRAVNSQINQVKENLSKSLQEVVPGLPHAFQAALYGVMTAEKFDTAVRDTISCGGCTCSRACFIGACLGAKFGFEAIPNSWISKNINHQKILEYAKKITKHLE